MALTALIVSLLEVVCVLNTLTLKGLIVFALNGRPNLSYLITLLNTSDV